MPRIAIGAVVEIQTSKGYAYALYSHKDEKPPRRGALLRVLDRRFEVPQDDFGWISSGTPQFNTFFPLGAAVARGLVRIAWKVELPQWAKSFPLLRGGAVNPATRKVDVWWLFDGEKSTRVDEISDEQRKLSMAGTINYTLLRERIEQGYRPEMHDW
jgi:hypothetical protein